MITTAAAGFFSEIVVGHSTQEILNRDKSIFTSN
jgi:hypothetical protein